MPTLDVINTEKKKVGTVSLSDDVYAAKVNVPLVHQVVKAQLASRRQGNAKTKTKGEVRGGGKKPYRQKGTGNARRGSSRSPLVVGGGTIHGPKPRNYDQRTPKEMVRGALRSVLSDRLKSQRLLVVDEFSLKTPKTKAFHEVLTKKLDLNKVLIVDDVNKNLELSARNIPHVKVLRTEGLNVYDVLKYDWLLLSKKAAQALDTRLAKRGN
jgi:large subunit ribosomal protein L4